MLIKMRTTAAGPDGVLEAGKTYNVTDAVGTEWMKLGYAVKPGPKDRATDPVRAEKTSRTPKE